MVLVIGAWGCGGFGQGVSRPVDLVQSEIDALLDAGEITIALSVAAAYERRAPGPESWDWLGRALWRSGELLEAESFHRRAAESGTSEGTLGLARAAAALGRLDEARSLAEQSVMAELTRARALRLLAALAWRQGDSLTAGHHLSAAAEASADAEASARLASASAAASTVPSRSNGPAISWRGSAATLPLERDSEGAPIVVARIGGTTVRLRLSLRSPRSTLSSKLVGGVGLVVYGDPEDGGHAVAPLALGGVASPAVPFRLQPVQDVDGELGFDVLSTLGWELSLRDARLVVRPPRPGRSAATGLPQLLDPEVFPTHWINARVLVDGLEAQLLLLPRLSTVSVTAGIDLWGPSRISHRGLSQAIVHDEAPRDLLAQETIVLATRLGGFSADYAYRLESQLDGRSGSRSVTPQAVLGADFANSWGLRWSPELEQLSFVDPEVLTR